MTTPTPEALARALLRDLNDRFRSPRGDYYVADHAGTALQLVERHMTLALTEQVREIEQTTVEAAAKDLEDRATEMLTGMRTSYPENIAHVLRLIAKDFRARAAQGGTG